MGDSNQFYDVEMKMPGKDVSADDGFELAKSLFSVGFSMLALGFTVLVSIVTFIASHPTLSTQGADRAHSVIWTVIPVIALSSLVVMSCLMRFLNVISYVWPASIVMMMLSIYLLGATVVWAFLYLG